MNTMQTATIETEITTTVADALEVVTEMYSDTLAVRRDITAERADRAVTATKTQSATEMLLLLARFHADNDDAVGSSLLAEFAVKFAEHESKVV